MTRLVGAAVALAIAAAGCGGDAKGSSSSSGPLVVSAATSLKAAFTSYGHQFGAVRLSFAGSDQLAAQIRQGVRPDVFASANTTLPDALYADGLVEKPAVFAGNRLVLAVPAKSAIGSLAGVERAGTTLAVGSKSVPIGAYTRKVLARLPAAARKRVLANVRSEEPDVGGIVGKLMQGAVDAGFVYVTDVAATRGALKAIELPAALQPAVKYEVAVVKGARHRAQARRFIAGLLHGAGRQALGAAGFELP